MFEVGVMAYMRVAILAVVLVLTACGNSSGPKGQSSSQPSPTPTPILVTPASSPMPTASPNPTAGSPLIWAAPVRVDHQPPFFGSKLVGVSCSSIRLCVAVDYSGGNVVTSSDPTGGAAAWTVTHVKGSGGLSSVSCPSSGLCVAGDYLGNVVTSTSPTGGAVTWLVTHVDGSNCAVTETGALCALNSMSCANSTLCVAVDQIGNVVTSTNPTAGPAAWKVTQVGAHSGVSCPSTTLCVAVGDDGFTSSNPNGRAAAWKVTQVVGANSFGGVSCPSVSLCVAVDELGNVVTSSNPAGGAAAWTVSSVDGTTYLSPAPSPRHNLSLPAHDPHTLLTPT